MTHPWTDEDVASLPLREGRAELLEEILADPVTQTSGPARSSPVSSGRRTSRRLVPLAAAVAVLAVVAVPLALRGDDTSGESDETPAATSSHPTDASGSPAGNRGGGTGEGSAGPSADPNSPTGEPLPLQPYVELRNSAVLHDAVQTLVTRCWRDQGYTGDIPSAALGTGPERTMTWRRYTVVPDRRTARERGYAAPGPFGGPPEKQRQEVQRFARRLHDQIGRPPLGEGCWSTAREQFAAGLDLEYITPGSWVPSVLGEINSYEVMLDDPRVKAAQEAFGGCMAERGYRTYEEKGAIVPPPEGTFRDSGPRPPSQAEVERALWDVTCQEQTHLTELMFRVEAQYQRAQINARPELFAAILEEKKDVLRRAAEILGKPAADVLGEQG